MNDRDWRKENREAVQRWRGEMRKRREKGDARREETEEGESLNLSCGRGWVSKVRRSLIRRSRSSSRRGREKERVGKGRRKREGRTPHRLLEDVLALLVALSRLEGFDCNGRRKVVSGGSQQPVALSLFQRRDHAFENWTL